MSVSGDQIDKMFFIVLLVYISLPTMVIILDYVSFGRLINGHGQSIEIEPERQIDKVTADARAQELLDSFLTEAERCCWADKRYVDVASGLYTVTYRVWPRIHWSIQVLGGYDYLCMTSGQDLPVADRVLAHVLNLRHNEAEYLKAANGRFAEWHRAGALVSH